MIERLSILIPTYNDVCVPLVSALAAQAVMIDGLTFEIIVAEDGSTDRPAIEANAAVSSCPHCRHIVRERNVGRAAIRNFLAEEARYPVLLFLDSDMRIVRDDFVRKYVEDSGFPVVYGGNTTSGDRPSPAPLKFQNEYLAERLYPLAERRRHPHSRFNTSNFLVSRSVMLRYPFDRRIRAYGYEDVLFGKTLAQAGIPVGHIDNPVGFAGYESNPVFIRKNEEALRTLHSFSGELADYSQLLQRLDPLLRFCREGASPMGRMMVRMVCRCLARPAIWLIRPFLLRPKASLRLFRIYKPLYYLSLLR